MRWRDLLRKNSSERLRLELMDKSLRTAAEIRRQLSDRDHSDSTEASFEEILTAALSLSPGESDARHLAAYFLLPSVSWEQRPRRTTQSVA